METPVEGADEQRRWSKRASWAGLLVLLVAGAMGPWNPRRGCGEGPLISSPILVFEFMRDGADGAALFGGPGACQQALLRDFFVVNGIDYAFMPAYGVFVYCGLRAAGASPGAGLPGWLRSLGAAACLVAPLADAVENAFLLGYHPGRVDFSYGLLGAAVATKFTLLGVVSALIGAATFRAERGVFRWLSGAHFFGLPIALLSAADPHRFLRLLQFPFLASWVALLAWALVRRRG